MITTSRRLLCFVFALSVGVLSGCGTSANQSTLVGAPEPIAPVRTALDEYVARSEPAYQWERISQRQIGQNEVTTLSLTSQTWQGIAWKHRIEIVRPEKNEFPTTALLYLSTSDSAIESMVTQSLAGQIGATVVHVMGMPNQPLFGMREDDLIAHTFAKYLETGDETWPLLLPMTKAAVKAMDAVQEYSAQQNTPLQKFIVTGASKRGWTTWLVAAADTKARVAGIIPIVYDNLNIEKQLPHQFASWGEFSPMIQDYTRRGLQQQMESERGRELVKIVDPYTYRARLTMPKYILNGTNDPYWTTDALNLYWDDLPEPKNVYYAPNAGHGMNADYGTVLATMGAWFRRVAGGKELPTLKLHELQSTVYSDKSYFMVASVSEPPKSVRIWVAQSKTGDFRTAKWESRLMEDSSQNRVEKSFDMLQLPLSKESSFMATFSEATLDGEVPLRISSPILVKRTKLPPGI